VSGVPEAWSGLVDDAAIFPPGDAPLPQAVAAYQRRRDEWYAELVGPLVVRDTDLPDVPVDVPVSVVLTGGAGAIAGVASLASKRGHRLVAVEAAVRDLDDLAGSVRRLTTAVDAARAEGGLDEAQVYVELPQTDPTPDWLAAADAVAEAEHRLKLRTGGVEAHLFPSAGTVASWIDSALDRETPFKCTAGLHHAVRRRDEQTGFEHHGFLNVLLATRASLDGGSPADVAAVLEQTDGTVLALRLLEDPDEAARTRRWFESFGSCSVLDAHEDLVELGILP
jgi:hypothetical protein